MGLETSGPDAVESRVYNLDASSSCLFRTIKGLAFAKGLYTTRCRNVDKTKAICKDRCRKHSIVLSYTFMQKMRY